MSLSRARQGLVFVCLIAGFGMRSAFAAPKPATIAPEQLIPLLEAHDSAGIAALGPGAMPALLRLYEQGDAARRTQVANTWYQLSWKSEAAKELLLRDMKTPDPNLRISVQYALGRVSDEQSVVDALLANMREDGSALIRDKAACALAYDQPHLSERQKVHLYEGLIAGLEDPQGQVRRIAHLALQIQTGQDKGYRYSAPTEERAAAIAAWRRWLEEYRAELE